MPLREWLGVPHKLLRSKETGINYWIQGPAGVHTLVVQDGAAIMRLSPWIIDTLSIDKLGKVTNYRVDGER